MPNLSKLSILFVATIITIIAGCTPTTTYQPVTTGASQEVTGRDLRIVTGQTIDFNEQCQHKFGTCVQAHHEPQKKNGMKECSIDTTCL